MADTAPRTGAGGRQGVETVGGRQGGATVGGRQGGGPVGEEEPTVITLSPPFMEVGRFATIILEQTRGGGGACGAGVIPAPAPRGARAGAGPAGRPPSTRPPRVRWGGSRGGRGRGRNT